MRLKQLTEEQRREQEIKKARESVDRAVMKAEALAKQLGEADKTSTIRFLKPQCGKAWGSVKAAQTRLDRLLQGDLFKGEKKHGTSK